MTAATAAAFLVRGDAAATDEDRANRVNRLRQACKEYAPVLDGTITDGAHACDTLPIFSPSVVDVGRAAIIDDEHIRNNPEDVSLNFVGAPASEERVSDELFARGLNIGEPRVWYNQFPACDIPARGDFGPNGDCQE